MTKGYNTYKTIVYLTLLSTGLIAIGSSIAGISGTCIAATCSLLIIGISFFYSDKIILSLYKAQPLEHHEYAHIHTAVHNLCMTIKMPVPRLWIMDSPVANAFATGRSPQTSSIVLTTGIIQLLSPRELNGVLAHELAHIHNRDTLITSIAAIIATAISYTINMLYYSRRRKKISAVGEICIIIFMPLAASLIKLALSRTRELHADECAAHTSRDPVALAQALERLHTHTAYAHFDNEDITKVSMAGLFIIHPFLQKGWVANLFSTHPPVTERMRKLYEIYHKQAQSQ